MIFTSGALSDPVLFDTLVQHWLLAIDRDRIAVGLSLESPPACTSTTVLLDNDCALSANSEDKVMGFIRGERV